MNMQNLMAQAQKVQADMQKNIKEIEEKTFSAETNGVYVEMNGKSEITKIEIQNQDILTDKEILQDLVLIAVNNVTAQIKEEKQNKLGKYTNGLGGMF